MLHLLEKNNKQFIIVLLCFLTPLISTLTQAKDHLIIDLNKLQTQQQNCRVMLVFENKTKNYYTSLQLNLAFFNKKGVIEQQITIDASPLRHHKTSIKEFDVPQLNCSNISRVLLNSVAQCTLKKGMQEDCINQIRLKSTSKITFLL